MSQRVFLFDLDGVLVEPLGYRRVTQATLTYFTERMGVGPLTLSDEVMDLFESQSITSEWDISAVCLTALFEAALATNADLKLPYDLVSACDHIREIGLDPMALELDYEPLALRLGREYQPGLTFAALGYRMSQSFSLEPLFPHLAGHALLKELLAYSRDVRLSPVTRIFQQLALGTRAFRETYGLPAEIEVESYLLTYDRPLLEPELRESLLRGWEAGEYQLAAYTVRPSLARHGEAPRELPYAPEAEMALELVGLEQIPLVGYGQVCQLARLTGLPADQIAKPSMIHALGAIGAAVTRDELRAMSDAAKWASEPTQPGIYASFPPLEITVFEDSPWSIRAVQQAGELLNGIGIPTRVNAYGISRSPTKVVTLIEAGAEIAMDVNAAVRKALGLPV
jgi:hypothetical protein